VLLIAPVYGLWIYCTGTRESIGRHLSTDDLESIKDLERYEGLPEFEMALRTRRDARLVQDLSSALEKHGAGSTTTCEGVIVHRIRQVASPTGTDRSGIPDAIPNRTRSGTATPACTLSILPNLSRMIRYVTAVFW
jgi:hypothetical protein